MIARNERNQIKKRLAKQHQQTLVAKQRSVQVLLNAVLWQLIRGIVKNKVEDYDESLPAVLNIPKEALGQVPANFALQIGDDADNVPIIATFVKPKSNILLADGSPAPSDPTPNN